MQQPPDVASNQGANATTTMSAAAPLVITGPAETVLHQSTLVPSWAVLAPADASTADSSIVAPSEKETKVTEASSIKSQESAAAQVVPTTGGTTASDTGGSSSGKGGPISKLAIFKLGKRTGSSKEGSPGPTTPVLSLDTGPEPAGGSNTSGKQQACSNGGGGDGLDRAERGESKDSKITRQPSMPSAAAPSARFTQLLMSKATQGELAIWQLSQHSSEYKDGSGEVVKGNCCQRAWTAATTDWRVSLKAERRVCMLEARNACYMHISCTSVSFCAPPALFLARWPRQNTRLRAPRQHLCFTGHGVGLSWASCMSSLLRTGGTERLPLCTRFMPPHPSHASQKSWGVMRRQPKVFILPVIVLVLILGFGLWAVLASSDTEERTRKERALQVCTRPLYHTAGGANGPTGLGHAQPAVLPPACCCARRRRRTRRCTLPRSWTKPSCRRMWWVHTRARKGLWLGRCRHRAAGVLPWPGPACSLQCVASLAGRARGAACHSIRAHAGVGGAVVIWRCPLLAS